MVFPISISVVMPTFNTKISMLKESVESILNQTFRDFEFLIIDDGSTNGADVYLNRIKDKRVKIIHNPSNIGITKSLNIGLKQAKGKYIARMDADDISLPDRFEKQYMFMEANPDVIVCGTQTEEIINGKVKEYIHPRKKNRMDEYLVELLFVNPGPSHPTVMIRHEPLLQKGITYDERLIYAQDYGMWEATSHYGKISVINEVLLYHRRHNAMISVSKRDAQIKCDKITQKKLLLKLLDNVSDEEVDMHYFYSSGYYSDAKISGEVMEWYNRLMEANRKRRIYKMKALKDRVLLAKKILIRQSFTPDLSGYKKACIIFHYLSFGSGIRMILGEMKRSFFSGNDDN